MTPVKPVYAGCVAGFNQSSASTWVIYFYNFSIFLQQSLHFSTKRVIHFSNVVCHSRGFINEPVTELHTPYTWALFSLEPPDSPYLNNFLMLAPLKPPASPYLNIIPYLTIPQLLLASPYLNYSLMLVRVLVPVADFSKGSHTASHTYILL